MFETNDSQIRRDMQYLVGSLPHRGAYTESERQAAEYIRDRFQESTPDTEVDGFTSIESHYYLFASYYAEFLFVAIAAIWFPSLALIYGLVVFLAYLAEFTTYRVTARFLPQYESQNIVARFLAPNPTSLFVVTANYDSPREGPVTAAALTKRLRWVHLGVVLSMMAVLISCVAQVFVLFPDEFRPDLVLRWAGVAFLMGAAGVLFFHEVGGEFSSGAINNASGVAALLALAERLRSAPLLDRVEVWLVATGAKDAWMSGMHHFVRTHKFDRANTYFLHIDNVGSSDLRFVTAEGLLQAFKSDPGMLEAASQVAQDHNAAPFRDHGLPSDALVTLVRGYKSLRVTGVSPRQLGEERLPDPPDGLARVDYAAIARATVFVDATLRRLATAVVRLPEPAPSRSVN